MSELKNYEAKEYTKISTANMLKALKVYNKNTLGKKSRLKREIVQALEAIQGPEIIRELAMPQNFYVYFLLDMGEVVKVGFSENLYGRVAYHLNKRRASKMIFDRIMYIEYGSKTLALVKEQFYIDKYMPKYNKSELENKECQKRKSMNSKLKRKEQQSQRKLIADNEKKCHSIRKRQMGREWHLKKIEAARQRKQMEPEYDACDDIFLSGILSKD